MGETKRHDDDILVARLCTGQVVVGITDIAIAKTRLVNDCLAAVEFSLAPYGGPIVLLITGADAADLERNVAAFFEVYGQGGIHG